MIPMNYCDNIVLYLYDELNVAEKSAFELHLKSCPECRVELKDYPDVIKRLVSLPVLVPRAQSEGLESEKSILAHNRTWPVILRCVAVAAGFACLALAVKFIFIAPDTVKLTPKQTPAEFVSFDEWDNGIEDDITAVSNKTEIFNWNLAPLTKDDSNMEKYLSEIKQKINDLNTEIENDLAGL